MIELHRVVAYAIPITFGLLFLAAAWVYIRNREPGRVFWTVLAVAQGLLVVQLLVGLGLLAYGGEPSHVLHYVYGAGFPLVVLVIAHTQARNRPGLEAALFGVAAFLCTFSAWRAWITGP